MFFSKISVYIAKQILWSVLLVLLIIISLDSLSRIIEQSESIRENYNFAQLLYYIVLTLPGRAVVYMPYAALIGSLVGMGLFANNNELIVMRSAGLSMWKLIGMCLIPVTLMMLLAMFVAESLVPKLDHYAEQNRLEQRYAQKGGFLTQRTFWNREDNVFMRIDSLSTSGTIYGLNRYSFDDELRLISAQRAESATYADGQWVMHNIKETAIDHQNFKLARNDIESQAWVTKIEPRLLEYLLFDPADLNIARINKFTAYLEEQNLNTEAYKLAFWSKVFYPLIAISLILITISGIFGSMRQKSVGYRVFVGVVIGVVFKMVQNAMIPTAMVYDLSPFYASLFPILFCFAIGIYRLRRVH